MSLSGAVRRTGFHLRDMLKFPRAMRVGTQWREIASILDDEYERGWPKVAHALDDCLSFACAHSPFYRGYAGRKLADFPVLTKLDFLAHGDEIRTDLFREGPVWTMSTSGSTGTPFKVVQDLAKRNRVLAELKYFGCLADMPSHEKMFFLRARPRAKRMDMFWSNVWQKDIQTLKEDDCRRIFLAQRNSALRGILAYSSTYDVLTENWLSNGLHGNPSVRAVISMASYLSEGARRRAEEFWPNANVVSRYSNQENGIMAQETGVKDSFKANWASYYFEVLKFDSDVPADDGEVGRIVVTDMFNRAFPMIRYENGDVGALTRGSDGWLRLENIAGRRIDLIYAANGGVVSPHAISRTLDGARGIRQWQFIQEGKAAYAVAYVPDEHDGSASSADRAVRQADLQNLLGASAVIEWRPIGEIPVLASNKRKVTVQKWFKPGGS